MSRTANSVDGDPHRCNHGCDLGPKGKAERYQGSVIVEGRCRAQDEVFPEAWTLLSDSYTDNHRRPPVQVRAEFVIYAGEHGCSRWGKNHMCPNVIGDEGRKCTSLVATLHHVLDQFSSGIGELPLNKLQCESGETAIT